MPPENIVRRFKSPKYVFGPSFVCCCTLSNLAVIPNVLVKSTQIAGSTVMKGNYCTGMSEIEDFFRIEHYLRILQACTGIEDFGIALHHLEEANWVLMVSFLRNP